jgi:hypothetical protein
VLFTHPKIIIFYHLISPKIKIKILMNPFKILALFNIIANHYFLLYMKIKINKIILFLSQNLYHPPIKIKAEIVIKAHLVLPILFKIIIIIKITILSNLIPIIMNNNNALLFLLLLTINKMDSTHNLKTLILNNGKIFNF